MESLCVIIEEEVRRRRMRSRRSRRRRGVGMGEMRGEGGQQFSGESYLIGE